MSLDITVLRHGDPDKIFLSDKACNLREKLGRTIYDLIITSPLPQAKQMAFAVAGGVEGYYEDKAIVIHSLLPENSDPRMATFNKIFEKVGHAPLKTYQDQMRDELDSLAQEIKADVWNAIVGAFCDGDLIKQVLIVGHGILIPAFCQAFTGRTTPFAVDVPGECEGYKLTATDLENVLFVRFVK